MRLLLLGDSLVEFYDWQARFPAHDAVNRGSAGETVAGLLASLPGIMEEWTAAEGVVLMVGTNNLLAGDCFFLPDYEKILLCLRQRYPAARILVAGLPPLRLPWLAPPAADRLNALLADLAQRQGARWLDLFSAFQAGPGPASSCFSEDGVHFSDRGYQLWSALIETNL